MAVFFHSAQVEGAGRVTDVSFFVCLNFISYDV